jgi:hypothetical protein
MIEVKVLSNQSRDPAVRRATMAAETFGEKEWRDWTEQRSYHQRSLLFFSPIVLTPRYV